jgi:Oxysterol-binding protein
MESHGSVVTHLLSQVKIGMDLTKVVLPTFILERRSLLEMYADYFAHPDLFIRIADFKDPRDRMVQVVRWYLSAYHAGRKSSVAKKPYNPIIGEVFRCHWNIPEFGESPRIMNGEAKFLKFIAPLCREQRQRKVKGNQRRSRSMVQRRSTDVRIRASFASSSK